MNSEMNPSGANGSEGEAHLASITLQQEAVQSMRHCLHELANVFTGVMIAGDLLSLQLTAGSMQRYAEDICVGSERGCVLVREIRSQLLAACGEAEVVLRDGRAVVGDQGI
jgi:nitrogen-specific signal transduction histidine kinase